ncbi:MAG TPA: hypothetical protein PKJ84_15520 [Anaerolineales bacterium]|nr:hypothetical protein [Anaerolineales bacterium]HNO95586.1 hypothetical protein [Anaerolineales bacterium]
MRRLVITLFLFLFLVSACGAPSPDDPVSNDTVTVHTPAAQETSNYIPSPADGSLTRGEVSLEAKELASLESYPVQFMLQLKGELPTPCHQLRIATNPPDKDHKVLVDVYSVVNPAEICIQVLAPFEIAFPLGSYPEGKYSLWVNGEMVAEFQA